MIFTIYSDKHGSFDVTVDDDCTWALEHKWYVNYDTTCNKFYVRRWDQTVQPRKAVRLHRAVIERELERGLLTTEHVDHINGDTLDNRRENLRVVNNRQNHQNRQVHREGHLLGTNFRKDVNLWVARIRFGGKRVNLGYFKTQEEAHQCYLKALSDYSLQIVTSKS